MKPCVKWTDDCQGKKDYDGRLVSVSTRYWPKGYGPLPSATAEIVLNHGEPDRYGFGDRVVLVSENFEADTEQEVKQQVEIWVQEKFDMVRNSLSSLLGWKS